ncbi:MAG: hypothetical protein RLZZ337_808 [Bacteroidota bacterium]
MQKTVFVGIILVIGLFSLQYSIASLYSDQFKPQTPISNAKLVPVNLVVPECKVVYIYPEDTVIEVVIPKECPSL